MMTLEIAEYIAASLESEMDWLQEAADMVRDVPMWYLRTAALEWHADTADDREPLGRTPACHVALQMFTARWRGIDPGRVIDVFVAWAAMPNRTELDVRTWLEELAQEVGDDR
jgi:hypothetical protein